MWKLHDKNEMTSYYIVTMILGSLPYSFFTRLIISDINTLHSLGLAAVRILKLLRLPQIHRYFDILDIESGKKVDSYIRTVQVCFYLLLATHLIGCFWLIVGRLDPV